MGVFSTVLLPLLTIIASGLVASIVTFRLNAGLQRSDHLRGKLEEAYAASHDYCTLLTTHFVKYLNVFRGALDINQANDLTISLSKDVDHSIFRRLEMLVAIYVPAANDALTRAIDARDKLGAIVSEHRRRYEAGDPTADDLTAMLSKYILELDVIEKDFKAVIVKAVRKL